MAEDDKRKAPLLNTIPVASATVTNTVKKIISNQSNYLPSPNVKKIMI